MRGQWRGGRQLWLPGNSCSALVLCRRWPDGGRGNLLASSIRNDEHFSSWTHKQTRSCLSQPSTRGSFVPLYSCTDHATELSHWCAFSPWACESGQPLRPIKGMQSTVHIQVVRRHTSPYIGSGTSTECHTG